MGLDPTTLPQWLLFQLSYPGVALSRDFRYICAVNYKLANMLFDIKELIYGPAYDRCAIYDCALSVFEDKDFIPFYILENQETPPDFDSVFRFLESEGLCRICENGIFITERGRLKILRGGYTRALLIERLTTLSVIIAIFGAIAGGALYFIGV